MYLLIFILALQHYDVFCVNVTMCRNSCPEVFCKKGVLRNFVKFTGKHLCQNLFLNKVAGLSPATLLKKKLWHSFFPIDFVKFLRTPFFIEHLWYLLLDVVIFQGRNYKKLFRRAEGGHGQTCCIKRQKLRGPMKYSFHRKEGKSYLFHFCYCRSVTNGGAGEALAPPLPPSNNFVVTRRSDIFWKHLFYL